jgi:hypothetical protein
MRHPHLSSAQDARGIPGAVAAAFHEVAEVSLLRANGDPVTRGDIHGPTTAGKSTLLAQCLKNVETHCLARVFARREMR